MRDWPAIRTRYLKDDLSIRLGGLATNLARIGTFSRNPTNPHVVYDLAEESKHFIEWTAAEAEVSVAARLVEIQVELALWQLDWNTIWTDTNQLAKVAEQATAWSSEILEYSGLLRDQTEVIDKT
jgi:hypothetical protein